MGFPEFVLATFVTVCAMVGGAILNAAITSPVQCKPILDWLWPWFRPFVAGSIGLFFFPLARHAFSGSLGEFWSDFTVWIAIAEGALLGIFVLADKFVDLASPPVKDEIDREK
jgi:hypothetical protein